MNQSARLLPLALFTADDSASAVIGVMFTVPPAPEFTKECSAEVPPGKDPPVARRPQGNAPAGILML